MKKHKIVIRPNVGKSTIFNRLLKKRDAVIHPQAGVTRDRKSADLRLDSQIVELVDTGGIFPDKDEAHAFSDEILIQVNAAIEEAQLIIFIVDATAISGADYDFSEFLHKTGKDVLVIANKYDLIRDDNDLNEIYSLGFASFIPISAEHNINLSTFREKLSELAAGFKKIETKEIERDKNVISFAIIGRPNVGKSSLVNSILKSERTIVSEIPGTTRDSISEEFTNKGQRFKIIDTAGLRRKSKVKESVEFYSTVRTRNSIRDADITILLIEPDLLITDQDKKIASIVMEEGRALIFAINKWDLIDTSEKLVLEKKIDRVRFRFPSLANIPIVNFSAKTGKGVSKIFKLLQDLHSKMRISIPTSELNRFIKGNLMSHFPTKGLKKLRIYYGTQTGQNPPKFTFFVSKPELATEQYANYIRNRLYDKYNLTGIPLRINFKDKNN